MPIDDEFKRRAGEWDEKHGIPIETPVKKEAYGFDADRYSEISTQKELDELREQRQTPEAQLNYDIGGSIQQEVWTTNAYQNEQRIEYLHDKLEERAQNFERNFDNPQKDNEPEI